MTMDTEASLREYLKLQLHMPIVGRIGPVAKAFDFLATAAPGVREILTVGKLCFEVRDGDWDMVVVDAPATGHIVGQLAAPQAVNGLVKVGLIRTQTDWMLEMLSDPADHRAAGRVHARGDAGHRDHRAGRAGPRGDDGAAGRRGGQPGPARAVRPPGGGGLRGAGRPRGRWPNSTSWSAATPARCWRRPGWPSPCAAPVDPPRAPAPGDRPRRAAAVPALPVHPVPRAAHHPPGGRRRSARSWASDGDPHPAPAPGRPDGDVRTRPSTACWPPRRSSWPAGPAGSARPPRPRRRR